MDSRFARFRSRPGMTTVTFSAACLACRLRPGKGQLHFSKTRVRKGRDMSTALAVHHGVFGRVALYSLDRSMALACAPRRPPDLPGGRAACLGPHRRRVLSARARCKPSPISPWQPHNYQCEHSPTPSLSLTLYISPSWFLEASRRASSSLRFGRNTIEVTDPIQRLIYRVTQCVLEDADESLHSRLSLRAHATVLRPVLAMGRGRGLARCAARRWCATSACVTRSG